MPLNTLIERDGETLVPEKGWSAFAVTAMVCAAAFDSGEGPFVDNKPTNPRYPQEAQGISPENCFVLMDYTRIATTPLSRAGYTLKKEHKFHDNVTGEILHLLPGDVLKAWRD